MSYRPWPRHCRTTVPDSLLPTHSTTALVCIWRVGLTDKLLIRVNRTGHGLSLQLVKCIPAIDAGTADVFTAST